MGGLDIANGDGETIGNGIANYRPQEVAVVNHPDYTEGQEGIEARLNSNVFGGAV